MHTATILLVVDQTILREGIRRILEQEPDIAVVGEARDGLQAVDLAMRLQPDLALMDLAVSQADGMQVVSRMVRNCPGIRVLMLAEREDAAIAGLSSLPGIRGFVSKDSSASAFVRSVRLAHGRGTIVHGHGSTSASSPHPLTEEAGRMDARTTRLTLREQEVLTMIAEGNANKQTAMRLGISRKTVEKHRDNLMKKLGIHNAAGLTRFAIGSGIAVL